jgi:DNA-binding GntR family transcriptional regulator
MQRLERDGLIMTLARRDRFIRDVSTESMEAICIMRGKLEALCVGIFVSHCPKSPNKRFAEL